MLNEKILTLREMLIGMSALVQEMIESSIRGLLEKDGLRLREIIDRSEPKVNQWEVELDDMATSLIALHEPKARDLRLILMAMRINNDLERIGDHAVNIAESGLYLVDRPPVKSLVDIPRMAELAVAMLRDALAAFIREDAALARAVLARDDEVDALRLQVLRELVVIMTSEASAIERALHLDRIAQNLERSADLSTNVAEDVIYLVEGTVVKHHALEPENR